jgi:hypothetical protein
VAWHKTKSFTFSVRSAYYIEWEHQFGSKTRRNDGQSSSRINPVWDILWKLNVPRKVKIFLWRSLHGVVPRMVILASRHIKVPAGCPICNLGPEDIKHILFTYVQDKDVWKDLGLSSCI